MIIGTIFSIMPAFVYWLAGTLAANGSPDAPTAGTIVAFTTLQSRLFFPLGQLLGIQVEIQGSLALFDRIFEYLEMDPEIVDAPDAVAMDRLDDARQGPLPRRLVPLPDGGRAIAAGPRRGQRSRRETAIRSSWSRPEWAPEAERRRRRPRSRRRPADARWRAAAPGAASAAAACRASRCRRSSSSRRSGSRASTSWPNRASWSPSSGRRARARRRPPTSSRGCTTSIRARSRSTTSTSAGSSSPRSARSSGP